MATQSSLIENRTIRVFISSTFSDMNDERTELIRRTFPRLRELASQRDVTLTEVDLRWGITKEESESRTREWVESIRTRIPQIIRNN